MSENLPNIERNTYHQELIRNLQESADLFTQSTDDDGYPTPTEPLIEVFTKQKIPNDDRQLSRSREYAIEQATYWLIGTKMVIDSLKANRLESQ